MSKRFPSAASVRSAVRGVRVGQLVEALEQRRMLAAQVFPGQGPGVGADPRQVATGDFNADGRLDFATANYTDSTVTVALGLGNGGFGTPTTLPVGTHPTGIVAADFDNNGFTDLAVANSGTTYVTVLKNVNGTLTPQQLQVGSNNPSQLLAVDWSGDGKLDLVVANTAASSLKFYYFRNNSVPGTIGLSVNYIDNSSTNVVSMTAGDFNGDGLVDFATTGGTSGTTINVYRSGASGPTVSATLTTTSATKSIVAADYNADGKADLAALLDGGAGTGSLVTYRNTSTTGAATFTFAAPATQVTTVYNPATLAGGDFNADNKPDLTVFTTNSLFGTSVYTDTTVANATTLTLTATATGLRPGAAVVSGAAGDFNNDNKIDLVAVNDVPYDDYASLQLNTTTAGVVSFDTTPLPLSTASTPKAVATADFDGDGKIDIAAAGDSTSGSGNVGVQRNTTTVAGSPTFAAVQLFPDGIDVRSLVAVDLNGDAKPDLALLGYGGQLTYLRNTSTVGAISFAPAVVSVGTANAIALVAADFDQDGRIDLANIVSGNRVAVRRNITTAGTFNLGPETFVDAGAGPTGLAVISMDSYGSLPSLVVSNGTGMAMTPIHNDLYFYGAYGFSTQPSVALPGAASGIVVGDFDLDGLPDVAVTLETPAGVGQIEILQAYYGFYYNAYLVAGGFGLASVASGITRVDYDYDGRPDLAVSSPTDSDVSLFHNTSSGYSNFAFDREAAPAYISPSGVAAADFDNNNRPDLVVTHALSGGVVTVLPSRLVNTPFAVLNPDTFTLTVTSGTISKSNGLITVTNGTSSLSVDYRAAGAIVVSGTVNIVSDLGSGYSGPTLRVNAGAVVNLTTTQQYLSELDINGTVNFATASPTFLRTGIITTGPAGKLDLQNNDLIYDIFSPTDVSDVRQLIGTGYAGGAWTGFGLTSSTAKNNPAHNTGIGYMTAEEYYAVYGNNALFDGQSLAGNSIVIRYTLYGDTDLDRGVSINDFNSLATHFGVATGRSWRDGDFDYDGGVSINDFNRLAGNFGKTLPAPAASPNVRKGVAPAKHK